mmetsp:Transcript_81639/g.141412  ORF Transcript_81639/g.141412 Transcript_81639/m.141412 type:complete len:264 (-) Transcript_81639:710-1501(-)
MPRAPAHSHTVLRDSKQWVRTQKTAAASSHPLRHRSREADWQVLAPCQTWQHSQYDRGVSKSLHLPWAASNNHQATLSPAPPWLLDQALCLCLDLCSGSWLGLCLGLCLWLSPWPSASVRALACGEAQKLLARSHHRPCLESLQNARLLALVWINSSVPLKKKGHSFDHQCLFCSSKTPHSTSRVSSCSLLLFSSNQQRRPSASGTTRRSSSTSSSSLAGTGIMPAPRDLLHSFSTTRSSSLHPSFSNIPRASEESYLRGRQS